jgi:hypothetical protein
MSSESVLSIVFRRRHVVPYLQRPRFAFRIAPSEHATKSLANVISVADDLVGRQRDYKGKGKARGADVSAERPKARPSARGTAKRDIARFAPFFFRPFPEIRARYDFIPLLICLLALFRVVAAVETASAQTKIPRRRSARRAGQDASQTRLPFAPVSASAGGPSDEV